MSEFMTIDECHQMVIDNQNKRIAELEADKASLTKDLADKQEQLDILAHKALDLEAENKRLREALSPFASIGDTSYYSKLPNRLDVPFEWCNSAYETLKLEPPKEQE